MRQEKRRSGKSKNEGKKEECERYEGMKERWVDGSATGIPVVGVYNLYGGFEHIMVLLA
jgi:hypothetical protein